jgi:hypothetical protein
MVFGRVSETVPSNSMTSSFAMCFLDYANTRAGITCREGVAGREVARKSDILTRAGELAQKAG